MLLQPNPSSSYSLHLHHHRREKSNSYGLFFVDASQALYGSSALRSDEAKTDLRAWWRQRPWMMFRVWVEATTAAMKDDV
ncbi:uncharacterized protein G2W53_008723 [Senna tora]|uniref:Uncharacterized protein n=1 Tax=Senna tora TaxID=362788 RepID=A0A835C6V9_9FABA|nr:uncharacterized protein G2W53_008723 [Senna tora]